MEKYSIKYAACNNLHSPTCVPCDCVELSWKLVEDTHCGVWYEPEKFHIRIYSVSSGLFWEDNITQPESMFEYAVPFTLKPGSTYYWDVEIFNDTQNIYGNSVCNCFTTDCNNWSDEWMNWEKLQNIDIFRDTVAVSNSFICTGTGDSVIYIASNGFHSIWINGKKISDMLFTPERGCQGNNKYVVFAKGYLLTQYLKKGANRLMIFFSSGFSRMETHSIPAIQIHLFINQTEYNFSKPWKTIATGNNYQGAFQWGDYGGESILIPEKYIYEKVLRKSDWINLSNMKIPNILVKPSNIESDCIYKKIKPITIEKRDENQYFVDMGWNFSGWFALFLKQNEPVQILASDKKNESCSYNQVIKYYPCSLYPAWYYGQFNFISGRYFTVYGIEGELRKSEVLGLQIKTCIEQTGFFNCSNDLLNRIYQADIRTFEANTITGVTSDCPHRERLGYGETAINTSWGIGLPYYESRAYYRHMLQNWMDMEKENGYLQHTAPDFNGGGGTLWSSYLVIGLLDYFNKYHDMDLLEKSYPYVKKWLAFLNLNTKDGILQPYERGEWDFLGDWATPDGDDWGTSSEALFFNNACYAWDLTIAVKLAEILHKKKDVEQYKNWHSLTIKKICEKYQKVSVEGWDVFCSADARYQAIALEGAVPDTYRALIYKSMLKIIETKGYVDGGSAGTTILLRVLSKTDSGNEITYKWLNTEKVPSYGAFLKAGETTWPEMWDMRDIYGASKIHTCYTGVSGWIAYGLAGIELRDKQVTIKPYIPEDMEYMKCGVDSKYGVISESWMRNENIITFYIQIPLGIEAVLKYQSKQYKLHNGYNKVNVLGV